MTRDYHKQSNKGIKFYKVRVPIPSNARIDERVKKGVQGLSLKSVINPIKKEVQLIELKLKSPPPLDFLCYNVYNHMGKKRTKDNTKKPTSVKPYYQKIF